MKKRKLQHFLAAALALVLVGCSNEAVTDVIPGGDDNNNSKDVVYMNVTVQLPTGNGTRSTTDDNGGSSDGTEVGQDYENKVHSVLLVLADKDNKFIACAEKQEGNLTETGSTVNAVQSISKSTLSAYYGGENGTLDDDKQKINVFVFCNPIADLRTAFQGIEQGDGTWYNEVCNITETSDGTANNAAIWGGPDHKNGGFLMSSYEIATKKIPAKFTDWENFTDVDKPFNLTGSNNIKDDDSDNVINNGSAIKVERSVARFDFKDGSSKGNNTYDIVNEADNSNSNIQIQLQKMALVNMSNKFYYLRRVSDDGMGKENNYQLCGLETNGNYVVDTDCDVKKDGSIISGNKYKEHFNFCLGHQETNNKEDWCIDETARNQWYTSKITDVLGGIDDKDDDKWGPDYKIWRYVTENTIPGIDEQQKGISTGIVFKGKMIAPKDATGTLADALNNATGVPANDAILYIFGKDIYVRWTEVRANAIKEGEGSELYRAAFGTTTTKPVAEIKGDTENGVEAVEAVYSDDEDSPDYLWNEWYNKEKASDALKQFKKAATAASFTLYESSSDPDYGKGYYCYYFYWNRHNNNGNNGIMGPMEFGVVRNNVYKLAVTEINRLGHPRVSENDPDPIDPEDPDEEGDLYLNVSVEVLPWVVRINNIEF